LNSLFKVLFNFPSRYLFAIGLGVVFSLTWSLPRALSCTPKQLDSGGRAGAARRPPYGPITLCGPWPQSRWTWTALPRREEAPPNTTCRATGGAGGSVMGSARFIRHYLGHHGCFLFLRLLICLNLAGHLACSQVERSVGREDVVVIVVSPRKLSDGRLPGQ